MSQFSHRFTNAHRRSALHTGTNHKINYSQGSHSNGRTESQDFFGTFQAISTRYTEKSGPIIVQIRSPYHGWYIAPVVGSAYSDFNAGFKRFHEICVFVLVHAISKLIHPMLPKSISFKYTLSNLVFLDQNWRKSGLFQRPELPSLLRHHWLSDRKGTWPLKIFSTSNWGTSIRGLMRGMATFPQGNQELLVVRDKVRRPQLSLG